MHPHMYILLTICFPIDLEVCRHLLGANAKTALATNFAGVNWQPMPPPHIQGRRPTRPINAPSSRVCVKRIVRSLDTKVYGTIS